MEALDGSGANSSPRSITAVGWPGTQPAMPADCMGGRAAVVAGGAWGGGRGSGRGSGGWKEGHWLNGRRVLIHQAIFQGPSARPRCDQLSHCVPHRVSAGRLCCLARPRPSVTSSGPHLPPSHVPRPPGRRFLARSARPASESTLPSACRISHLKNTLEPRARH